MCTLPWATEGGSTKLRRICIVCLSHSGHMVKKFTTAARCPVRTLTRPNASHMGHSALCFEGKRPVAWLQCVFQLCFYWRLDMSKIYRLNCKWTLGSLMQDSSRPLKSGFPLIFHQDVNVFFWWFEMKHPILSKLFEALLTEAWHPKVMLPDPQDIV